MICFLYRPDPSVLRISRGFKRPHICTYKFTLRINSMARPLRICFPGASYHVFSRGNRKDPIFFSDRDRFYFIAKLNETLYKYGFILFGFCLMPNHYHLYFRTTAANLSIGIHQLNSSYSNWLKAKHKIVGHVFQGRFGAVLVDDASYALLLSAYIHLNPVRAKICSSPENYRWSSYLDLTGRRTRLVPGLDREFILRFLHEDQDLALPLYEQYVRDQINVASLKKHICKGIALGNEEFIRLLRAKISLKGNRREIAADFREESQPKKLDDIFNAIDRMFERTSNNGQATSQNKRTDEEKKDKEKNWVLKNRKIRNRIPRIKQMERDLAIYLAKKHCPLTIVEIGKPWNLDYGAVAQIVRRTEIRRREDPVFGMAVKKAEEILGGKY